MSSSNEDFFEGKRRWSVIKDEVLTSYMPAYLSKVKKLKKPIIIVDGFAGPGIFEDGTTGSPVIICEAAEKHVKGLYQAFFINKEKKHHEKLMSVLQKKSWLGSAKPILGDTTQLLPHLPQATRDYTIFLYLDPFGPTGSPFSLLEPFLNRKTTYSTEIVLMLHMPVLHRLAARSAVATGAGDISAIRKSHDVMDRIFGGDYWKQPMFDDSLTPEQREIRLINAYKAKLAQYLPFVGSCPVRASERERIKYFIVFASRKSDAMLLMNDAMAKAYFKQMHQGSFTGTLFEKSPWESQRSVENELREKIVTQVAKTPGLTRKEIWLRLIRSDFMRYLEKEYRQAVNQLVDEGLLVCPTPRKTKRLNDSCRLFVPME